MTTWTPRECMALLHQPLPVRSEEEWNVAMRIRAQAAKATGKFLKAQDAGKLAILETAQRVDPTVTLDGLMERVDVQERLNLIVARDEVLSGTHPCRQWFLEADMAETFWTLDTDDMPIERINLSDMIFFRLWVKVVNPLAAPGHVAQIYFGKRGSLAHIVCYSRSGPNGGMKPMPGQLDFFGCTTVRAAVARHLHTYRSLLDEEAHFMLTRAVRLCVNSYLYSTSSDPDILRQLNPEYDRLREKASRLPKGDSMRKKLETKLRDIPRDEWDVFRLRTLARRESDAQIDAAAADQCSAEGARVVGAHDVREHWRWQACGAGWSDHKLVLVPRHRRGDERKVIAHRMTR